MTLSDDTIVGTFRKKNHHSVLEGMMNGYPVAFRDLDEHIQDRLRAAEEIAHRPCAKTHSKEFTCIKTMGMEPPVELCPVCTIAATFQEDPE